MSKLRTVVALVEKNGRTLSKRTCYYENGQVAETGLYAISQNGWGWNIPIGVVHIYYESGQLKAELGYNESGSLDGESLYYSQSGKLLQKKTYSKDRLIKDEVFEEEFQK